MKAALPKLTKSPLMLILPQLTGGSRNFDMNLLAVIVPVFVILARLNDVVVVIVGCLPANAVYTSVFVYVFDWLAFRATCVSTLVLSAVGDTILSTSVLEYVVASLAFRASAVSTSVFVYVVAW